MFRHFSFHHALYWFNRWLERPSLSMLRTFVTYIYEDMKNKLQAVTATFLRHAKE